MDCDFYETNFVTVFAQQHEEKIVIRIVPRAKCNAWRRKHTFSLKMSKKNLVNMWNDVICNNFFCLTDVLASCCYKLLMFNVQSDKSDVQIVLVFSLSTYSIWHKFHDFLSIQKWNNLLVFLHFTSRFSSFSFVLYVTFDVFNIENKIKSSLNLLENGKRF